MLRCSFQSPPRLQHSSFTQRNRALPPQPSTLQPSVALECNSANGELVLVHFTVFTRPPSFREGECWLAILCHLGKQEKGKIVKNMLDVCDAVMSKNVVL